MPIFAYPRTRRFGLTHELLAWGRAAVWAKTNGARLIAPVWMKPRPGPYLRREWDKRNYCLMLRAGDAITGLRRMHLLTMRPRVEAEKGWPDARSCPDGGVVVFRTTAHEDLASFDHIRDHAPFLSSRLRSITRDRYLPDAAAEPFIAVHIRCGDFSANTSVDRLRRGQANARTPLAWYVDRLIALRKVVGGQSPVRIYSDGTASEIAPLLDLPNVSRAPRRAAITDLLEMSQAAALIGTGSGFSIWGAFLGGVPRISHPGQRRVVTSKSPAADIESAFHTPLPIEFSRKVETGLRDWGPILPEHRLRDVA